MRDITLRPSCRSHGIAVHCYHAVIALFHTIPRCTLSLCSTAYRIAPGRGTLNIESSPFSYCPLKSLVSYRFGCSRNVVENSTLFASCYTRLSVSLMRRCRALACAQMF